MFLSWLYQNYIKPQLEVQAHQEPIVWSFSSLECSLEPHCAPDYALVREFWATRAFLLGFRLGPGLGEVSLPPQ